MAIRLTIIEIDANEKPVRTVKRRAVSFMAADYPSQKYRNSRLMFIENA